MSLASVLGRSVKDRESWRYTDVKALLARKDGTSRPDPVSARTVARQEQSLLFVNGVWQQEQSHLGDLPRGIMQGDAESGYRLELAGQTCLVTSPLELVFVTTHEAASEIATRLRIELGANGRLTLIERHEAVNKATAHMIDTEIILHPQSKLVHGKIVHAGPNAALIAMTRVEIQEGAFYDNFALLKGGKLVRNEIDARLTGKLAQCTLNGIMLGRGHEHVDTTTRTFHEAPHGISRQTYKTVLAEQARGVFQGKIIVVKDAQKTDGRQLSRALLLSDQAEMNAKPELEIHADDVKCAHGATIGDLDADALFYLRARGLGLEAARRLLIHAFLGEVVDEIQMPAWRDECRAEVEGWLHEQN